MVCAHPYRIMRNADLTIDEDEAADLLKEILEVLKKLRLTIDIDTLSKFVYSAQRSAERNYGGA